MRYRMTNRDYQPYGEAIYASMDEVNAELDAHGVMDDDARQRYIDALEVVDSNNLTRAEAIEMVGIAAVQAVENESCEPTSRAYDHEDGEIEWSASVEVDYSELSEEQVRDLPIGGCWIEAVYYTDANDAQMVEDNGGDWGAVDWTIHHYSIR